MSRILMTSLAVKGHINPMLSLGQNLVAMGHTVAWLPRRIAEFEPPRPSVPGIELVDMEWQWRTPDEPRLDFGGAAREFGKFVELNKEWRIKCVEPLIPRMRKIIRQLKPDYMVIDGQVYPGVIAAQLEGIPYAGVITSPAFMMPQDLDCEFNHVLAALRGARAEVFQKYAIPPNFACWDYLAPNLNVVFALTELVGNSRELPPNTHLVGPSLHQDREDERVDFPWDRLKGERPVIYASFGTVWYSQPDLFRMIAEACAALGVQLVVTLGGLMDSDFPGTLPGDPVCVRYTPQLRMLERADVCISHGGANTVMESLYYGVPLLVIPLCTDQPVNAHFVQASGAGISIAPKALTTDNCREALARLLEKTGAYRKTVTRIQNAYRQRDGGVEGAKRITELFERNRTSALA
jgi:zeaxanthin glucosyltransferase